MVCASLQADGCMEINGPSDGVICTSIHSGKELVLQNVSQGRKFISAAFIAPTLDIPTLSTCNANGNIFELPTMLDIGLKVNSDKISHHGYHRYYVPALSALRNTPVRLLEIGLLGGGSLKLWKAFLPKSTLVGVDNGYQTGTLMDDATCEAEKCKLHMIDFDATGGWNSLLIAGSVL